MKGDSVKLEKQILCVHNIAPVYDGNSKILILGSFPSVKSREANFFYGHPQNRFWKLIAALFAEKDVPETIEQKKETIERQQPMVDLAELRISVCGCYTITDINKTFKFKKGKLTGYAKSLGMIHKTLNEVNKKGEEMFKVYSKDGKYNQIGITEKGLQWVKENKDKINNFTKE